MDDIGGHAYLAELWDAAPSAAISVIRRDRAQKAIVRNLIHACTELQADAYDQGQPASELLDSAERRILEIAEMGITGDTITLHDADPRGLERLDQRKRAASTNTAASRPASSISTRSPRVFKIRS